MTLPNWLRTILPVAFNGVLQAKGDVDWFKFRR